MNNFYLLFLYIFNRLFFYFYNELLLKINRKQIQCAFMLEMSWWWGLLIYSGPHFNISYSLK